MFCNSTRASGSCRCGKLKKQATEHEKKYCKHRNWFHSAKISTRLPSLMLNAFTAPAASSTTKLAGDFGVKICGNESGETFSLKSMTESASDSHTMSIGMSMSFIQIACKPF